MPEPAHASLRSSQTIALIESGPLNPAAWEELAEKVHGQNDPLSVKSLEIIIAGLKKVEEVSQQAQKNKTPPPRLSVLSQSMFVRLAKAYNSPTLLKEIGLIYLRDLGLPEVALHHFERSLLLGGPEKELRPLMDAAAGAAQRQNAMRSGQEPVHAGVVTAQHAKPVATTIIRKTGKMLLPARFPPASAPRVTETEDELTAPPPATTAECLAAAEAATGKGHLRRAAVLLQKANREPAPASEMWQAWTNLGQAHYEAGDYPGVESTFLEALQHGPEEMASHFNVGLGYHLNKKYDLAIKSYLKANELEARHPKVWCNLGVLYFQQDAYEKAESALRCAVEADPQYARARDNLAAALGAQDKLEEAIGACLHAVELRPDYPEAYFKLGVIYFTNNKFEQAAAEFGRAALLPALTVYCDAFLAMVHARLEQPETAEADVRRAAQADPQNELLWMAWNDLGLAWYSEKNYPRAATAYDEAARLKPDEAELWFNLGVSRHRMGDLKAARDSYRHAVTLKESFGGAWHNLGTVCAENGDLAAAQDAFQKEVHWVPGNVRAWYDLGVTLEKLGRKDEAKEIFAKADALGGASASSAVPLPPGLDIRLPQKET